MSATQIWLAEFDTPYGETARGCGRTPEEAVQALVEVWQHKYAPMSEADPEYILKFRDDVTICACMPGEGYVKAGTDHLWHKKILAGDDRRFDAIFEASSPKP